MPGRFSSDCECISENIMILFLILLGAWPVIAGGLETFYHTGPGPYFAAAGDLNGDGKPDLVVPCRGDLLSPELKRPANDTISVFLANATAFDEARTFHVGFGPYTAAIADIDGDGLPDVAVANYQSNDGRDLAILYGSRDREKVLEPARFLRVAGGGFDNEKSINAAGKTIYAVPGVTSVAFGDFNGDGRKDMAAVAWTSDFLVVFLNQGQRNFRQRRYPLLPGPRDVVVADFDGDRIEDLAITLYSSNMVDVWRGDGKGAFSEWRRFHSAGSVPYHLKAGDLDGDGRLDLVVGNRGVQDNVAVFRNTPERFALIGSYSPATPQKGETTADEIRDVHLRDLNGDGKLDLIAACHVSHKVVIWMGTGDAHFGKGFRNPRTIVFAGKGPRAIATFDSRIAVALFDANELVVFDFARYSGGGN